MKQTYYFEMTDTYGQELNYCWVHRFKVEAKSLRGALTKISREVGYNFRFNGVYYKAQKACVGLCELGLDQGLSGKDLELLYDFKEVCDKLTKLSHSFSDIYLYVADDGLIYFI